MRAPVFSRPVPPDDLDRVRAVAAGGLPPAVPRLAATVALVRDGGGQQGDGGLEVYLMRRVGRMAFAAGMHVFPGGSVDPGDHDPAEHPGDHDPAAEPLAGPEPARWATQFGTTPSVARVVARAAVRETLEECDVVLDARALTPIAHWVTPELEPRRYDTYFFLASLPDGQECRATGTEADLRLWVRPREVADRGLAVMPPTVAVLADLARFDRVSAAVARRREIATVTPLMRLVGDRLELDLPGRLEG